MRRRLVVVGSSLFAFGMYGCADPCLDDGLGQINNGADCAANASAGATDSETNSASDSAATASDSASDTIASDSNDADTATVTDSDSATVTDSDSDSDTATATATATTTATDTDTATDSDSESASDTEIGVSDTEGATTYCVDADLDGFGDPTQCVDVPSGEVPPNGTVPNADDCDDGHDQTFPGAAENESNTECMRDDDEDGYGDDEPPQGVTPGSDCADDNADAYPGAAAEEPQLCTIDEDQDGYGDATPPDGVDPGTDCVDDNPNAFPGAAELDDPVACMEDEDDDGYGDSDPPPGAEAGTDCDDMNVGIPALVDCMVWCRDDDGDQYGDASDCVFDTEPPTGYVGNNSDCDDDHDQTFPGAAENDSNTECMRDDDEDGYGDDDPPGGVTPGSDCDDDNPGLFNQCVPCNPGELSCTAGEDLAQCNGNGTSIDVIEDCQYGCDGVGFLCWDELTVVADQFVCIDVNGGEAYEFQPTVSGGDGNYAYDWDPDAEIVGPDNIPNAQAQPTLVTTYSLNVTDGEGNFGSDTVTIHVAGVEWNILTDCDFYTFPDPFNGFSPDPDHAFSNNGTVACNLENSLPNAYVCPNVYEQSRIIGRLTVTDDVGDDDSIGFVWGWQDERNFYILSWKQSDQDTPSFGLWPQGVVIKRVQAPAAAVISAADILGPFDTPNSTLLAGPATVYDQPWVEGEIYEVNVAYDSPTTDIVVTNLGDPNDPNDDTPVFNYVVNDGTFPSGQFGTFDASQINACNGPWSSQCL